MHHRARIEGLRTVASTLEGIDVAVYQTWERDPLEPIIGAGDPNARVCIFGRDPGRDEVRWATPFIGAGGQKVRATLYQVLYGQDLPDFQASLDVGAYVYWANTVPYKPVGNKAWSMGVQRAAHPYIADVLVHDWRGTDLITLGRNAFFWFGIGQPREERKRIQDHWQRVDRFETSIPLELTAPDGQVSQLTVHPLPHPSPLNATWYKRFPGLLANRLRDLDLRRSNYKTIGDAPENV